MEIRRIELDCAKMTSREAAHAYLMEQLSLPAYYGKNLDALYDCLQEAPPSQIHFVNQEALSALGAYGDALLKVFHDAAREVPNIELIEA